MLKNFNIVIFILLICYFLNVGKENFSRSRRTRRARVRRKKNAVTDTIRALTKKTRALKRKRLAFQKNNRYSLFSNKSRSQFR